MNFPRQFLLHATLGFAFISAALAQEKLVLSDDFEKARTDEKVAQVDSAGVWSTSGGRLTLSVLTDPEGLNSGKALSIGKGFASMPFPTVNLEVGQTLTVKFRFRYVGGEAEEIMYPFRVGLLDDESGNPGAGLSPGYWFMTNPALEENKGMITVETGTDGMPGGGQDFGALADVYVVDYVRGGVNTLTYAVTRMSDNLNVISTQLNEASAEEREDNEAQISKFTALAINLARMEPQDIRIDDLSITVTSKK